ncbi:MAG TPA: hypothetical protein VG942_11555 [Hyphomonadaceae bacterium]|nr:hypothetical protein [Hyphomonadaceae bacterium]
MSRQPVNRFVRSAWRLLIFQLAAGVLAVGVTAWAAFQVAPLLQQKQQLETDITRSKTDLAQLSSETTTLKQEQAKLQATLANARQSADFVSRAITQYHNRNYTDAVRIYDQALALDGENSYILDLKSYSQYRASDVTGAIDTVRTALKFRPDYIYGYSELARYACAAKDFESARQALDDAKSHDPGAGDLFSSLMAQDGEFHRLCAEAFGQKVSVPVAH